MAVKATISITYSDAGGQRMATNTSTVFINENGRAFLQVPSFRADPKGIVGKRTFDDNASQDQSSRLQVDMENDPAGEVASVLASLKTELLNSVPWPYERDLASGDDRKPDD